MSQNRVAAWPYVLQFIALIVLLPIGAYGTFNFFFPLHGHTDTDSRTWPVFCITAAVALAIYIPCRHYYTRKRLEHKVSDLTTAIQVAAFQNKHLISDIRSAGIDQQYSENEDLCMGWALASAGGLEGEEEFEFMGVNLYAGSPAWLDSRGYVKATREAVEDLRNSSLYYHLQEIENLVDGISDYQTRSECAREVRNYKWQLMRDYVGCYLTGKVLTYPGLEEKKTPQSVVTKHVLNGMYKNRPGFTPYVVHLTKEQINEELRWVCKNPVPALIKSLGDPAAQVRVEAARGLRDFRPVTNETVRALIKSLCDPEAVVRKDAANALAEIGPEANEAVLALIKTCRDADADVRFYGANALGRINPKAKEAIQELERLAEKDPEEYVRAEARFSLKRIAN